MAQNWFFGFFSAPLITVLIAQVRLRDLWGGEMVLVMLSTSITQPDYGVYQLHLHWQAGELIGVVDKDSHYPVLFWQLGLISEICQPSPSCGLLEEQFSRLSEGIGKGFFPLYNLNIWC